MSDKEGRFVADLAQEGIVQIAFGDTPYQMKASERVIQVDSALGAVVVILPPMAEAKGRIYSVGATVGATADVSVNGKESGTEISSGGDLDANDDASVFYCTGRVWVVLGTTV